MSLDEATVARIARLARIRIEDEERSAMAGELSTIMDWIEQLNEVNTEGVPPMTSMDGVTLALRADEVTDGDKVEDVLANAPAAQDSHFVVPKVVE